MISNRSLMQTFLRHVRGVLLSIMIGFAGGFFCGAVIFSLCCLAGRSQTGGKEYLGYWSLSAALVGAMYGAPLGLVLGPIGYATIVRKTGFRTAILPAAIGTIAGGFAGSLLIPGLGVLTGIAGFCAGLVFVRYRYSLNKRGRSIRL